MTLYLMGEGAWGITTIEQALSCLGVAENDGDVQEVLDALMTMQKIEDPTYRKAAGPARDDPSSWHAGADGWIAEGLLYGYIEEIGNKP